VGIVAHVSFQQQGHKMKDLLHAHIQRSDGRTPATDLLELLLELDVELGPGNDGLFFTYLREVGEEVQSLMEELKGTSK